MRFFLFLLLLFPSALFAEGETQGFTQYVHPTETSPGSFECSETCFIVLGRPTGDVLDFTSTITGQGIVAYGYLVG